MIEHKAPDYPTSCAAAVGEKVQAKQSLVERWDDLLSQEAALINVQRKGRKINVQGKEGRKDFGVCYHWTCFIMATWLITNIQFHHFSLP